MKKSDNKSLTALLIFLLPAILSLLIIFIKLGLAIWFWIILIIWIFIYLIFYIKKVSIVTYILWGIIAATFIFSLFISFDIFDVYSFVNGGNKNTNTSGTEKSADGIALTTCTSTASDTPVMLDGWKSTIYSAALISNSPDPDKANNIRSFSYSGIKSKTEKNSIYARIEKADGSYISGYGIGMEACSADNKTTASYAISNDDNVASDNVVASVHYFHGGRYLHGPGAYRVDIYVKTLDGKWHLIDRLSDITITE